MLEITGLNSFYGHIQALHDVNISLEEGEIVTLFGANGAGKTTSLKSIMGLLKTKTGQIMFEGKDITKKDTVDIVSEKVILVAEGRRIFPGMTVYENLEMGAVNWRKRNQSISDEIDNVYEIFPKLKERHKQRGWSLSGGEAQMLAVGRGLMAKPKLLLLDEPSLGLSPILVEQVFEALVNINKRGISMLLVEQNAHMALGISNRGYLLENGHIVLQGLSEELQEKEDVKKAYLGL